jgi:deuterolysin
VFAYTCFSAPKSVYSVDDVKVTVSVTNTGSEAVKVLKYGTALDSELPTKSFVVTKDGKEASFGGIKVCLGSSIAHI